MRRASKLIEVPTGLGHADDRHVEVAALHHRLQRREDLLVGQIAGGAEEDQGVGMGIVHEFSSSLWRRFFQVSAELKAHGREQFVLEVRLAARGEAFVERRGEHGHRHAFVDGGLDRPAAFARIRDSAREFGERGIFDQRGRRQVEQPRGDHAAAPPHLGDVAQVEVVLVVLGVAQRRRLGVDLVLFACRCWRRARCPAPRRRRP